MLRAVAFGSRLLPTRPVKDFHLQSSAHAGHTKTAENAAWSYEDAYDEAAMVEDYMAFYWGKMDLWIADDAEIEEQPAADTNAKTNPLVDWLVHDAWKATSTVELVEALVSALDRAGFPIWSLRLFVRTLNPQLFARFYSSPVPLRSAPAKTAA